MKYGYKTPSINVKVEGINIPKLSTDEKTTIDISIGEGALEVEGNATELIDVTVSMMKEIKSFTEWFIDITEQVSVRQAQSFHECFCGKDKDATQSGDED